MLHSIAKLISEPTPDQRQPNSPPKNVQLDDATTQNFSESHTMTVDEVEKSSEKKTFLDFPPTQDTWKDLNGSLVYYLNYQLYNTLFSQMKQNKTGPSSTRLTPNKNFQAVELIDSSLVRPYVQVLNDPQMPAMTSMSVTSGRLEDPKISGAPIGLPTYTLNLLEAMNRNYTQGVPNLYTYAKLTNQSNVPHRRPPSEFQPISANFLQWDSEQNDPTKSKATYTTKSIRLKSLIQQQDDEVCNNAELNEICEFARYFKLRRLALGLTQTQVGSALNAQEGPAYSQSAICRFEKLDVTAKSAKRMKPVLERWLSNAEIQHGTASTRRYDLHMFSHSTRKRKRRTCFSPNALTHLVDQLRKNPYPSKSEMTELSEKLTYDREVIRVWFCNRRQALKSESTSVTSTSSDAAPRDKSLQVDESLMSNVIDYTFAFNQRSDFQL